MLRSRFFLLCCLLGRLWFGWQPALAEQPAPQSAGEFQSAEPSPEQRGLATAAVYLLIVVVIGVVSLLMVVILWGGHVRRQVLKPLPTVSPKDPLWYLKPKRRLAGEPPPPPPVSDSEMPQEDPPDPESKG